MLILFFLWSMMLILILYLLFFLLSKGFKWEKESFMIFECGFSSYFFSRFSFSMHYFMISIIFLLFDLELCMIMPYFNSDFYGFFLILSLWIFIFVLIMGLFLEWKNNQLDWKF